MEEGRVVLDAEWRFSYVNAEAERMMDLGTGGTGAAVGKAFWEHLPQAARAQWEPPLRQAMSDRISVTFDGTKGFLNRCLEVRAVPSEDGGITIYLHHGTERVQTAETPRDFDDVELLAAVVEGSHDAIVGKRLDGTITSWNPAAERMYGFRAEEAVGRNISTIIPLDRQKELTEILERLGAGERIERLQTVRRRKDGSLLDVSVTISPIRNPDGDVVGASAIAQDVTEQKRAQDALRRSEGELNDFFENSLVGLHWVGPDGTILRANQAELDLMGYRREEYVGRHLSEFDADQGVIEELLERLKRGESLHKYEARLRRKDGVIRNVLIDSNSLWEDGRFVHSRCFTRDVTAEKQAEQALRISEERLRLALNAGRMGVWDWEISADRLTWTEQVYQIHGIQPGAFGGRVEDFQKLIHPEDAARVQEALERALVNEGDYDIEFRIVRPNGEERWVFTAGVVVRHPSDGPKRMLGATIDITERKAAEVNLRFLKEASDVVAVLADVETTVQRLTTLAVPFFADWALAYLVDERGQIVKVAQAHGDPDTEPLLEESSRGYALDWEVSTPIVRVLQTREPEFSPDVRNERGDGTASEYRHLAGDLSLGSFIVVPLERRGRVMGAIAFMRSDRRQRYSSEDVDIARELGRRAATAIDNHRLYDQIKREDEQKDDFLAMLAHELRNPLAAIDYASRVAEASPEQASSMVEVIMRQVGQLSRLIDDLLDVSRITRNKIQLRKESVDAATLVNRAIATTQSMIEEHGHRLVVELSEEALPLFVDPTRGEQIIINLLTNAAKYTPRQGTIVVAAFAEADEVVVRVEDSGIGIAQEMLPRIFELFTQVDSTIARTQGGLGIGLPVVRRLVEMHGGSVSVTSEGPGKGSEARVRLPLYDGDAQPEAPPERATSIRPGLKVLVVDDNLDTASSAARLLETLGCVTQQAHDGSAALELASSFRPDVVLLDIGLPGLDGYEVARAFRQNHELAKVKLYAISGYGQERDLERSTNEGFDGHFAKPLDFERLLERLAETDELGARPAS